MIFLQTVFVCNLHNNTYFYNINVYDKFKLSLKNTFDFVNLILV